MLDHDLLLLDWPLLVLLNLLGLAEEAELVVALSDPGRLLGGAEAAHAGLKQL